jgi:hypothetical protein
MGLLNRMGTIIKAKMSKLINAAEDPRETLDYSYEKQIELLQNVKRGVAEVTTSKKRLQLQREKLLQSSQKLDGQAREAARANREDLARLALERRVPSSRRSKGWTSRSSLSRQSRRSWLPRNSGSPRRSRSSGQRRRPSRHSILLLKRR